MSLGTATLLWHILSCTLVPCSTQEAVCSASSKGFFFRVLKKNYGLRFTMWAAASSVMWNVPEERSGRKRGPDLSGYVRSCENQCGIPAGLNLQNCNCCCLLICLIAVLFGVVLKLQTFFAMQSVSKTPCHTHPGKFQETDMDGHHVAKKWLIRATQKALCFSTMNSWFLWNVDVWRSWK